MRGSGAKRKPPMFDDLSFRGASISRYPFKRLPGEMRNKRDHRSTCRLPDWSGPDDLEIKITGLRDVTGWKVPIQVKVAGSRP